MRDELGDREGRSIGINISRALARQEGTVPLSC